MQLCIRIYARTPDHLAGQRAANIAPQLADALEAVAVSWLESVGGGFDTTADLTIGPPPDGLEQVPAAEPGSPERALERVYRLGARLEDDGQRDTPALALVAVGAAVAEAVREMTAALEAVRGGDDGR